MRSGSAPSRTVSRSDPRGFVANMRARFGVLLLWVALSAAAIVSLTSVSVAQAHVSVPVPSLTELLAELQGLSREISDGRAKFDDAIGLREDTALAELSEAQVAFFEEDFQRAAARLLALTSRKDIQRLPAFPEALIWLGESLHELGMFHAAAQEFRRALAQEQSTTHFRYGLERYLRLSSATEPLSDIRIYWEKYQSLRVHGALEPTDRDIRYLYGKALFRGGARAEAASLFATIEEEDPHYLKALYFLGVLLVAEDELKSARVAFEGTVAAYAKRRRHLPSEPPAHWDVEPGDGPALEITDLEVQSVGQRDESDRGEFADEMSLEDPDARVAQLAHLAIARIDGQAGQLDVSWHHYRSVPPGSPDFPAAVQEATWILYRRGQYAWCAKLIDHLLAGRGDDLTAAELGIWKAHMLTLAADYETARASYGELEVSLLRRAGQLEADSHSDPKVFPEAVLAWSVPDMAKRARSLETALVVESEQLEDARTWASQLRAALSVTDLLPGVKAGQALHAGLSSRLTTFLVRLATAEGQAHSGHRGADALPNGNGPAANLEDVFELRQGSLKLAERLARFATAIAAAEQVWRARVDEILNAEVPVLEAAAAGISTVEASSRLLASALRTTAMGRLNGFAADAHFRQLDLAYWRKDEISRAIKALRQQQKQTLAPMQDEMRDFFLELRQFPIDGYTPGAEAQ